MDNGVKTCEQVNGDLWTRDWRILGNRAETHEQDSRDLWTNERRLLPRAARYTDPVLY